MHSTTQILAGKLILRREENQTTRRKPLGVRLRSTNHSPRTSPGSNDIPSGERTSRHYNKFHFPEEINCIVSSSNMAYIVYSKGLLLAFSNVCHSSCLWLWVWSLAVLLILTCSLLRCGAFVLMVLWGAQLGAFAFVAVKLYWNQCKQSSGKGMLKNTATALTCVWLSMLAAMLARVAVA